VNQENAAMAETTVARQENPDSSLSWYAVSDEVKGLLKLAAEHWEDTELSERYINQALELAEDNPDVLVSAYRYFFYKHNNPLALRIAEKVLALVRESEQLPNAWEELYPLLLNRKEEPAIRLYLNAYAASGLIWARLGEVEKAKEISTRVGEIDDRKEFGGSLVFEILTAPPDEDE
jgi:tetratricopeptide (TPR) repeat protein